MCSSIGETVFILTSLTDALGDNCVVEGQLVVLIMVTLWYDGITLR